MSAIYTWEFIRRYQKWRILHVILFSLFANLTYGNVYSSAIVVSDPDSGETTKRISQLLSDRLGIWDHFHSEIVTSFESTDGGPPLLIRVGVPHNSKVYQNEMIKNGLEIPNQRSPGPEGFLLGKIEDTIWIAGADVRGCLYGVGEFLRQIDFVANGILIPDLMISRAPAFEIRGTQYGQSGTAKRIAKVRDWTEEESQEVILDYALAGANIFTVHDSTMFQFIKSYGLMTQGSFGANTAPEVTDSSWLASESIGRKGYVCLSVEEANRYMLEKCEKYFKASPTYDLIKFQGGDGGGCECDRCDPYGAIFIQTVEKMAKIIHKYHPKTRIYFTNQKFDNADDNAIFDYLHEESRDWLWAWGFGPGSDATTWQPGHRQTHRMDLFRYPGFGPYGLYPQEVLHQLPRQQSLLFYNEITHWKYAQHAYIQMYPRADRDGNLPPPWSHEIYERRPDQYLTMVYSRQTFYAWPKFYHRVFNDLMRYGVGDITHSSGHHDHYNQWMWQRLLWSPRSSVEDILEEYCDFYFGKEAAADMMQAILLLEENMQQCDSVSLTEKGSIRRYYNLVKVAGVKMHPQMMEGNWLYRLYMQKGALDLYIQTAVKQQEELKNEIEHYLSAAELETISISDVKRLHNMTMMPSETMVMQKLRQEAERLGTESNQLFGVRNDGLYNLSHDFVGLGWIKRQLQRAIDDSGLQRPEILSMICNYQDPGDGGFYDNLGTGNLAPHVVTGYPYDHGQPYVSEMLSEDNLPSQRSMHFTQDESIGVTLQYEKLDPNSKYQIRFTFVRPWFQDRYAERMNQKTQSIFADDILIAKDIELPLQMSDFFTFDIPQKATADGALTIQLRKQSDVASGDRVSVEQWRNSGGWGTLVSEVWLIKQ